MRHSDATPSPAPVRRSLDAHTAPDAHRSGMFVMEVWMTGFCTSRHRITPGRLARVNDEAHP